MENRGRKAFLEGFLSAFAIFPNTTRRASTKYKPFIPMEPILSQNDMMFNAWKMTGDSLRQTMEAVSERYHLDTHSKVE